MSYNSRLRHLFVASSPGYSSSFGTHGSICIESSECALVGEEMSIMFSIGV